MGRRQRRHAIYWVIESDRTALEVVKGGADDAITLTIEGPLDAVTLREDGVGAGTLPELRFDNLRVGGGDGVIERLRSWARQRTDVRVSLGCLIDRRGTVDVPTLSGVIAAADGTDIVFGDMGLISR